MAVSRSSKRLVATIALVALLAPAAIVSAVPSGRIDVVDDSGLTGILRWSWGILRSFVQGTEPDASPGISPDGTTTQDAGPEISPDG